jgi:hypothetical protein
LEHINIIDQNTDFLAKVVDWMAMRRSSQTTREGLACEVICKHPDVWQGIGVYTVCELFFIAGAFPKKTKFLMTLIVLFF